MKLLKGKKGADIRVKFSKSFSLSGIALLWRGLLFQKKDVEWLETLYIPMMLSKTSQTLLQKSLPTFHECIQGRECCIYFSLLLSF